MTKNETQPTQPVQPVPEKKDNTVLIVVLIVVGVTVVLPIIMIFGLIFLAALLFTTIADSGIMDDLEFDFDDDTGESSYSVMPEHSESLVNIYNAAENPLVINATVSKKDCLHASYSSAYINGGEFDRWFGASFCEGESMYVGAEEDEEEDAEIIYISDGQSCAKITGMDEFTDITDYTFTKLTCPASITLKNVSIVDTKEEAVEFPEDYFKPRIQSGDDDEEEVHIKGGNSNKTHRVFNS